MKLSEKCLLQSSYREDIGEWLEMVKSTFPLDKDFWIDSWVYLSEKK
jgi:hypothetical protein